MKSRTRQKRLSSSSNSITQDFPGGSDSKASCLQCGRPAFDPWVEKILWWRQWHPTPVLLPGKSQGQRSMVGYSPLGRKESDTTEQLHFYFSLSRIGEGNGNPLQCSCLENPRDGGAWWAAIYGVAQSRTGMKRLSSNSSSNSITSPIDCTYYAQWIISPWLLPLSYSKKWNLENKTRGKE